MKVRSMLGASLAAALLMGGVFAAESLKSGPQVGRRVTPFEPLHVTGSGKGNKGCLVCKHGNNPVAMIFAREVSDDLTRLVKKIDETTDKNRDCRMGSFVVFCSDEEGLKKKLEEMADKQHLKRTTLAIDNPAGPEGYDLPKDADVTVVLYTQLKVKVNHAYKKGALTEREVQRILSELPTILPKK